MRSANSGAPVPLVGRELELEILSQLYDGPSSDRVVVIHGEAGVGKTQLVKSMRRRAEAAGALVVGGRAHRFGADASPYLPLLSALHELERLRQPGDLPELAGLIASVEAETRAGDRPGGYSGRLVREIGDVFRRASVSRPIIVVVDDVQWADPTTMEVLAFLADGYESEQVSLVIVYRDEGLADGHPLHGWLVDLRKALPVRSLPLPRLNYEETADQIVSLLGPEAVGTAAELFDRSAGNPYLTELLCQRHMRTIPEDPPAHGDVESTLRDVLLSSWHQLSPMAREVVRGVSIAGRPNTVEVFARVAATFGVSAHQAETALQEGVSSGLLVWEPSGDLWFRHPLTAEILESTLMPNESARLHLAFAAELERHPSRSHALSDRALHMAAAGEPRVAFDLCLEASGREKARGSRKEAANLYRRAVELWPQMSASERASGESLCSHLAELSEQLLQLGDFSGAVMAVDRAYDVRDEVSDPIAAGRALTLRAQLHRYAGVIRTPDLAMSARAVELTSADPASTQHVLALAGFCEELRIVGDTRAALELADKAIAAASHRQDPLARGWALMARLSVSPNTADREEMRGIADSSGLIEVVTLDRQQAGFERLNTGDWAGCVDEFRAGFEAGSRAGATSMAQILGAYLAMFQIALGSVPEARAVLRLVLASRPTGMCGVVAHSQSLIIATRAGDERRADLHLRWLRELVDSFEDIIGLWGPTVLAEHFLSRGRPQEALDLLRDQIEENGRFEPIYGDLMLVWAARAAHELCLRARDQRDQGGVAGADGRARRRPACPQLHPGGRLRAGRQAPVSSAAKALFEAERAACLESPDTLDLWRAASEEAAKAGLQYDAALALMREAELPRRSARQRRPPRGDGPPSTSSSDRS